MEVNLIKEIAKFLQWDQSWVVASLALLWAYKLLKDKLNAHRLRKTETLEKLTNYLKIPKNEQDSLMIELLFEDHFGKPLSAKEISYFKRTSDPAKNLKAYLFCLSYVSVDDSGRRLVVRKGKNLKARQWLYFLLYTLFGMIAFGMLEVSYVVFSTIGPRSYAIWGTMLMASVLLAGLSLHQASVAGASKKLVEDLKA